MITKYALYYGVDSKGKKQLIELGDRNEFKAMKLKAKDDLSKKAITDKYDFLVVANDFGVQAKYKVSKSAAKAKAKPKSKKDDSK